MRIISDGSVYNLTETQLETLWHSLGMNSKNYGWRLEWWLDDDKHRNYFCTDAESPDDDVVILASVDLMKEDYRINGGRSAFYSVTDAGIRVARDALFMKFHRVSMEVQPTRNPTMSKRSKQPTGPSMFGQGVGAYGQAVEKPAAKVEEPAPAVDTPTTMPILIQDVRDTIALIDEGFESDARAMLVKALEAARVPTDERTSRGH